jgi:hypothetical protein
MTTPILTLHTDTYVHCIICQRTVPAHSATAGSLYATGRQAFACRQHLRDRPRWIIAWAVFDAHQTTAAPTRPLTREITYGCRP